MRFIRSLTTLIAYGVFFTGATSQGVLLYFLLVIFVRNHNKRQQLLRLSVKYSFKFFLWLCATLRVFKVYFENFSVVENIDSSLIIANHPTLVDYVILTSKLSTRNNSMVKHKLTEGFMGPVIRHLGYISNKSEYSEIVQARESGDNIVIFPEGTRTKDISKITFHRGAANIANRLKMPIYPAFIYCDTENYLNRDFLSLKAPKEMPKIYVFFGDKIEPSIPNDGEEHHYGILARRLNAQMEAMYIDKVQELKQRLGLKK